VFPKEILGDLLSLDWSYFQPEGVEFRGQVNFMKGGLVFADVLTTVSKTYAGEIQTPYFGEGLDGLLRKRSGVLSGIVNGIDYKLYNPSADPLIFTCYDARSLKKRQQNKIELQKLVGLPVNPDKPLLAMVSRLVASKGLELVARVLDEMLNLDIQVVVLGSGDEQYQNLFLQAAAQRPEQLAVHIGFDDRLAHRIFAGSDLFLMPSQYEPCGIGQLLAMRYGSLPIVRETGGLSDTVLSYNEQTGQGNGFSFTHYNAHDMLYTVERAVRLYQDKKIWNKIIRNAMRSNYSWTQSAAEYLSLYKALTEQDLLAKDQPSE
jgi:starch synthase